MQHKIAIKIKISELQHHKLWSNQLFKLINREKLRSEHPSHKDKFPSISSGNNSKTFPKAKYHIHKKTFISFKNPRKTTHKNLKVQIIVKVQFNTWILSSCHLSIFKIFSTFWKILQNLITVWLNRKKLKNQLNIKREKRLYWVHNNHKERTKSRIKNGKRGFMR